MFRKNKSFNSKPKSLSGDSTLRTTEPPAIVETTRYTTPAAVPTSAVVKKVEPKKVEKVPSGPPSIVPPGTKRVLVVGKFVVMTADVENCDAVIVQGNLDGNIKAKYIVIMKGGCMRGKLECEEADVAGSFEGMEMIAHHRLTLSATARLGGRTTYHRLSVHDGAILTGELVYKPSSRDPDKKSDKRSEKKSEAAAAAAAAEANGALSDSIPSAPEVVHADAAVAAAPVAGVSSNGTQ